MFNGFQNIVFNSLSLGNVTLNLIMALLCGLLISVAYRWIYQGPNYSHKFVQSMVLLSMITSLVIMVIGNNLARAFGLVGAMSIIRFRTAIKDTQEIVFIFFALAVGMATGVGLRLIAVTGTILIGAILLALHHLNYASPEKREFLLQFHCGFKTDRPPYLQVLEKICKRFKLVNMTSLGEGNDFELSFYVQLKHKDRSEHLMRELKQISEISHIRFFFDEE